MVDDFQAFAELVAGSFQELAGCPAVFVAAHDSLYEEYIAAFPAGSNPIFRTRGEHDCGSCRHFVRRAGGVVSVAESGARRTVWDRAAEEAPGPYRVVAARLRDALRAAPIGDIFRVGDREGSFGAALTRSLDRETGQAVTWRHLHTGEIPKRLRAAAPDQVRGDYRTTVQVFERGLTELAPDAVDTVLALVDGSALYRGAEHRPALVEFQRVQRAFLSTADRATFAWVNAGSPAARFRNTVIGTLVQDLSEGRDLEQAVASFETKVAPQNYKRTTALITPGMVKRAMETIGALGLEPALERRFAVIGDVSVTDVKWVDGAARPLMRGGIGELLMAHAEASRGSGGGEERAEAIGLDELVAEVLPETTGLELLFKTEHVGNLVSLTAPAHPEPKQLFRWSNDFAWSYCGNVTDSIRERVKRAGGKVDGAVLRVSLSWFNFDDLDLHVHEPAGRGYLGALGDHIYFSNKRGWSGGVLDVDMNAGHGTTREAVENVVWSAAPPDGAYRVVVNNYAHRETADPGFVVEVESGGRLTHYSYSKGVRNRGDVAVVTLHVRGGVVERAEVGDPAVTVGSRSATRWGLPTEQYAKVRAVMLSPNYWGASAVGNKHTIFILDGARSDEPARGFYTEFLHPRLEPHRKVFEVIADKTKCAPSEDQLSGLGFSSTKRDSFIVRAQQGKRQRLFHVHVGQARGEEHEHLRVRSAQ
jgi:hypothetical protein